MKKLPIFLILISCSIVGFSQKLITVTKLPNGTFVNIYDNKTWEYTAIDTITDDENETSIKLYNDVDIQENKTTIPSKTKNNFSNKPKTSKPASSKSYQTSSHYCGARTKSGGSCSRKVTNGNRCWQHGG